jgi:hypothetical protein
MVHRPSLRVGRKGLKFGNLEEQGRKKKNPNFIKISKNFQELLAHKKLCQSIWLQFIL